MTGISPGDLVYARGREWVALPTGDKELLCLRPLSGSEEDVQYLHPKLEREEIKPARFGFPELRNVASQDAARLLSEALRLSLRRGAGPFRSAARLGFEPRAYQLVPLLMALRLSTVRLLIADDVGIGKTIEAGLILRELIDRGEVERFSILCPPHLVEQWIGELKAKFDIDAVAVTSSSAPRLERSLLDSQSLFDAYSYTVVSLDYIKADKRRDNFSRACPKFVIVDEAHACVGTHKGKQQRFELLKRLATDEERHMVLLTATPHSGDEEAFDRLLGLLNQKYTVKGMDNESSRIELARHFVQRRRIDITGRDWGEEKTFPKHEKTERTYKLGNEHKSFHEAVLNYCLGVVEGAGADMRSRRLAFWGTLALMRCVGSSPAAALSALRNKLAAGPDLEEQVFDEDSDETDAVDVEPASGMKDDGALKALVNQAEGLLSADDPKIDVMVKVLKPLIDEGANPVIFCRFIATAEHVAQELKKKFKKLRIEVVTGALAPEERKARVEAMKDNEQRLLVATDCLSEGINLQDLFDTVVHYDLSWNPTRHQQREGRVDRFGQNAEVVRSILLYSPDSAIDGAVLEVILRKAETIRSSTGVTVPLPEERNAVTNALMNAVLLKKGKQEQLRLDLRLADDSVAMDLCWKNAEEGEKRSRARFAQNAIKPEEVAPEWKRWRELLGTPEQVERFTARSFGRLDAQLEKSPKNTYKAHLDALPQSLRERLEVKGLRGTCRITFADGQTVPGTQYIGRSHPLPAILAETLFEGALDPESSTLPPLGRIGAWRTNSVGIMTTVALLRLRYKVTVHARKERLLLVEEAAALAFEGQQADTYKLEGDEARQLLEPQAVGDVDSGARDRLLQQAKERIESALDKSISGYIEKRAESLSQDHDRVRHCYPSKITAPKVTVEPVLPADIIGVFVLVPGV